MRGQPLFVCFSIIVILARIGRLFGGLGLNNCINLFLSLNRELRGTHLSEIQYLSPYKNLEFKNLFSLNLKQVLILENEP